MKSRQGPEALITRKQPVSVTGLDDERNYQDIKGKMGRSMARLEMQIPGPSAEILMPQI